MDEATPTSSSPPPPSALTPTKFKKARVAPDDPLTILATATATEEEEEFKQAIARPTDSIVVEFQGRQWMLKRGAVAQFSRTLRSMILHADNDDDEETDSATAPLVVKLDIPTAIDFEVADRTFGYFTHFYDCPLSGDTLRASYVNLVDVEKPFFFVQESDAASASASASASATASASASVAPVLNNKLVEQLEFADYLDAANIIRCIAKYLATTTHTLSIVQMLAFLGRAANEDFTPAQYEQFKKENPEFSGSPSVQ